MKLIDISQRYFLYNGDTYFCVDAETDSNLNVRVVHALDPQSGREFYIRGEAVDDLTPLDDDALGMAYRPVSQLPAIDTSVPDSMGDDIHSAMQKLQKAVGGSTVDFVCERLQWSRHQIGDYLLAEQVDAVALAIYNIEARHQSIIIGDQTGIGKGRMAASLIRYAKVQGKKAIFITEKPKLFTDIYRDLCDTGSDDLKPFILASDKKDDKGRMEAAIYESDSDGNVIRAIHQPASLDMQNAVCVSGKFPKGYDFLCTTYSQFNVTLDPKKITKATQKGYNRNLFLINIAPQCILILDEAHNASGSSAVTDRFTGGTTGEVTGSNTFQVVSKAVTSAAGVCFLSATFAKTPNNMPLYTFRSCLSETGLTDGDLIQSIKKGGEALQEIISASLVREGQMVRREKTYDGIKVRYIYLDKKGEEYGVPDLEQTHRALSDNVTDLMRKIIEFERKYVNPVIGEIAVDMAVQGGEVSQDNAQLGVQRTEYFSRASNIVRQMLLSVKAEAIADHAIQQLKSGKKVVIALSQTFEAMLKDLMEELQVPADSGRVIQCDFGMALLRGLRNTMVINLKDEKGKSDGKMVIPVHALPPESQEAYYELEDEIKRTKTGVNISPIDIIAHKIRKAGYNLAEITGREYNVVFNDDTFTSGKIYTRRKESANAVVTQYQNNKCDVLIINSSGATGLSVHATNKGTTLRPDEVKPRCMIIAECELDISKEVQKRGRINRTGQLKNIPPSYDYVMSAVPAEKRNMMMLQKKLLSLDANTTSKQKQSTNIIDVADLLNKYGDTVAVQFLKDNAELNGFLGDPLHLYDEATNKMRETATVPDAMKKISGRVALLKCKEQEDFYNTITESYTQYVDYLKQRGEYDLEVTDVPLNATLIKSSVFTAQKSKGNSVFAAASYIGEYECDNLVKPYTATQVEGLLQNILKSYGDLTPQEYADQLAEKLVLEAQKTKKIREIETKAQLALQTTSINSGKLSKEKKQEKIDELNKKHAAQLFKIDADCNKKTMRKGVIKQFYAGRQCVTEFGYAVCLGARLGRAKNPYILSNITISFAVASSAKYLEFNLSDNGFVELGKISAQSSPDIDVLDQWHRLVSESSKSRETRQIITGNILAAYPEILKSEDILHAKFNVKLITFTLSNGGREKGILLPRDVAGKGTAAILTKIDIADAKAYYDNVFAQRYTHTTISFTAGMTMEVEANNGTIRELSVRTGGTSKFHSEIANDKFWTTIDRNGRGMTKHSKWYSISLYDYDKGLNAAYEKTLQFLASKKLQVEATQQDAEKILGSGRTLDDTANWKPLKVNKSHIPTDPKRAAISPLLLAELELLKHHLDGGNPLNGTPKNENLGDTPPEPTHIYVGKGKYNGYPVTVEWFPTPKLPYQYDCLVTYTKELHPRIWDRKTWYADKEDLISIHLLQSEAKLAKLNK